MLPHLQFLYSSIPPLLCIFPVLHPFFLHPSISSSFLPCYYIFPSLTPIFFCSPSLSQAHHIFPLFVISPSPLYSSVFDCLFVPTLLLQSPFSLPLSPSQFLSPIILPHIFLSLSCPSNYTSYKTLFPHHFYYLFLLIPSLIFFFQSSFLSAPSPVSFIPPSCHDPFLPLYFLCHPSDSVSTQQLPLSFIPHFIFYPRFRLHVFPFLSFPPSISLFHLSSPFSTPLLPLPRLAYLPSPLTVPSISPSLCPLSLSPSLCRNSTVTAAVFLIRGEERE